MIIWQKLEFRLKAQWSLSYVKTEFRVAYNNAAKREKMRLRIVI